MKHLPNALSVARIAITPLFVVLFLSGTLWAQLGALVLFILGAVSDWLDGEIARRYDLRSRLGQFLDPLADKVLVLGAFVAMFFLPADPEGRVVAEAWWGIPVAAIALRDVAVTWLRGRLERRGRMLTTRGAAKAKTAVQLAFLIALQAFLVGSHLGGLGGLADDLGALAAAVLYSPAFDVFLVFTALLTLWTGLQYFRRPRTRSAARLPATPAPMPPSSGKHR